VAIGRADDKKGSMSFTNPDVDLAVLPRFDEARLHALDPRYARLVLGLAALVEVPAVVVVAVVVSLLDRIPVPGRVAIVLGVFALLAAVAWFAHEAASVIRYAARRHDVIVRSGVFWTKEAVQPIKRIQHVEQVQGPLDKRFGLSTLKLFSAGTGYATFQIPGLDVETAAALSRFILSFHEPAAMGGTSPGVAAHAAVSATADRADGPAPAVAAAAQPSASADAGGEGAPPPAERPEP
jgi:membrane protein YdbS with pleckstrin-like domain